MPFPSLEISLRSCLAGSYANSIFNFWGTSKVLQETVLIYVSTTLYREEFPFPTSLSALVRPSFLSFPFCFFETKFLLVSLTVLAFSADQAVLKLRDAPASAS